MKAVVSVNMPKISIIIPIYNVSEYLNNCLNSVVNQTYKNLEIILVNDGSTDDSAEIARIFSDKDVRIQLVHQQNQGLSGARNTGLKYVTGDYVFYLDSDDYLENNALELLINSAQKHQADVVQGNFYYDYPDYLMYGNWLDEDEKVYNRKQVLEAVIEQKEIKNFAWGKLIQTEIAKKHLFPEGMFFEDTLWMTEIANEVQKYVVLKTPVLYYRQRTTGISGNFSIRNLDQLELYSKRLNLIEKEYPELYHKALKQFKLLIIQHQQLTSNLSKNERDVYFEKIFDYKDWYNLEELIKEEYKNQKWSMVNRIINRLFGKSEFIKINKEN